MQSLWKHYTTGDIIGIAMDLDNNKFIFLKMELGKIQGQPQGATGTGALQVNSKYNLYLHSIKLCNGTV